MSAPSNGSTRAKVEILLSEVRTLNQSVTDIYKALSSLNLAIGELRGQARTQAIVWASFISLCVNGLLMLARMVVDGK
ncbi:MAG: hypothetical protein QXI02_02955 [Candidatus Caldarchaeum sp.]